MRSSSWEAGAKAAITHGQRPYGAEADYNDGGYDGGPNRDEVDDLPF